MYRVEYDPHANILHISVSGFWKLEDVPPFAKLVGAKARQANAMRSDFNVLVESLDFPVQANDVADLLTSVLTGGAKLTAGWFAVVVGSQLNKLQAERTLVHPHLRVFLSLEEARAWLDTR